MITQTIDILTFGQAERFPWRKRRAAADRATIAVFEARVRVTDEFSDGEWDDYASAHRRRLWASCL